MHYRRVRNSFALDVQGLKKCFAKASSSRSIRLEVLPVANKLCYEKASSGSFSTTPNQTPRSLVSRVLSWFRSSLRTIHQHRLQSLLHHKPCPHHRPPPKRGGASAFKTHPHPNGSSQSHAFSSGQRITHPERWQWEPRPTKAPDLVTLVNTINKKSGKKMKIDLKKGKLDVKSDQYPELKKMLKKYITLCT